MIKSMTGFGKSELSVGSKKISVEVRSLNSKQLDLSLRMPSSFRALDHEIRALASKSAQRGKVDMYVNVESATAGPGGVEINRPLFAEYYQQLKSICLENGIGGDAEVVDAQLVHSVMRMPEVVSSSTESVTEDESETLLKAVGMALVQLDEFRAKEGAILIADMLERVGEIERAMVEIVPYEEQRVESVKNRIRESIAKVAVPIDSNRLEQEMIFYIEKLDITEEKVRLSNHCNYFREVASQEEAVGRKLGFISQEMGREINTLGSKANDAAIQRIVVGMKDELEKIKEQLLNIL